MRASFIPSRSIPVNAEYRPGSGTAREAVSQWQLPMNRNDKPRSEKPHSHFTTNTPDLEERFITMVCFSLCRAFVAFAIPSIVGAIPSQQPLRGNFGSTDPVVASPNFSRVRQNDSLCDAGSAQWTGTVRVGKGRNLFYCEC